MDARHWIVGLLCLLWLIHCQTQNQLVEGNVVFENRLYSEQDELLNQVNTEIDTYNSQNPGSPIASVSSTNIEFSTGNCDSSLGPCVIEGVPGQCVSPSLNEYICQIDSSSVETVNQNILTSQVVLEPEENTNHYVIAKTGERYTHAPYCSDNCVSGDADPECCLNLGEWSQLYTSTYQDDVTTQTSLDIPATLYPTLSRDSRILYNLSDVSQGILTDQNNSQLNRVYLTEGSIHYHPAKGYYINGSSEYTYNLDLLPGYIESSNNSRIGVSGFYEECEYDKISGVCSCPENMIADNMIADNYPTNPTCVNCPAGQTRGIGDLECNDCSTQNQVVSDGQCQPCLDQNQLHYIYDEGECVSVGSNIVRSDCISSTETFNAACSEAGFTTGDNLIDYYATCYGIDTCQVIQTDLGSDTYSLSQQPTTISNGISESESIRFETNSLYQNELCKQFTNQTHCESMNECQWTNNSCILHLDVDADTSACSYGVFVPLPPYELEGIYDTQQLSLVDDDPVTQCVSITEKEGYDIANMGNSIQVNDVNDYVSCSSEYVGTPSGYCLDGSEQPLSVIGCIDKTSINNLMLSPDTSRLDQTCDELCQAHPTLCNQYEVHKPDTLNDSLQDDPSYGCLLLRENGPCGEGEDCLLASNPECNPDGEEDHCCSVPCTVGIDEPGPGMKWVDDYASHYPDNCFQEIMCAEFINGYTSSDTVFEGTSCPVGQILDETKRNQGALSEYPSTGGPEDYMLQNCCRDALCSEYNCPEHTLAIGPNTPQGTTPESTCCQIQTCESTIYFGTDDSSSMSNMCSSLGKYLTNYDTDILDLYNNNDRQGILTTCCADYTCSTLPGSSQFCAIVNKEPDESKSNETTTEDTFVDDCCRNRVCGDITDSSVCEPDQFFHSEIETEETASASDSVKQSVCCVDSCQSRVDEGDICGINSHTKDNLSSIQFNSVFQTECCEQDTCAMYESVCTDYGGILTQSLLDTPINNELDIDSQCCQDIPMCNSYECPTGLVLKDNPESIYQQMHENTNPMENCCEPLMCDTYPESNCQTTFYRVQNPDTVEQGVDPQPNCCYEPTCQSAFNDTHCSHIVGQGTTSYNLTTIDPTKLDTNIYTLLEQHGANIGPIMDECCPAATCGMVQDNYEQGCPDYKQFDSSNQSTPIDAIYLTDSSSELQSLIENTCCVNQTCEELNDTYDELTCPANMTLDSNELDRTEFYDSDSYLVEFTGQYDLFIDNCCRPLMCDEYSCENPDFYRLRDDAANYGQGIDPQNNCCEYYETCENYSCPEDKILRPNPSTIDKPSESTQAETLTQTQDSICCITDFCSDHLCEEDEVNIMYPTLVPYSILASQANSNSSLCCAKPCSSYAGPSTTCSDTTELVGDNLWINNSLSHGGRSFQETCCQESNICDTYTCAITTILNPDLPTGTPRGDNPQETCCINGYNTGDTCEILIDRHGVCTGGSSISGTGDGYLPRGGNLGNDILDGSYWNPSYIRGTCCRMSCSQSIDQYANDPNPEYSQCSSGTLLDQANLDTTLAESPSQFAPNGSNLVTFQSTCCA